jgi:NAD(P)-dependent dehydrogenase (short-subunit alcohol dehydrogenase family)
MIVAAAPDAKKSPASGRSVLLAGASRGLGLGLAKSFAAHGWNVIATERNSSTALRTAAAAAEGRIRIERLDINDAPQVQRLRQRLTDELFDVIFIVAGVRDSEPTRPVHQVPAAEAAQVFISNAYSPMYFAEAFVDRLKPGGTLAIMTSKMASLTLVSASTLAADGTWEVYRASKAALNMLARCFHERHRGQGRTFLLMHPGWVKTDMGGEQAPVELATSVEALYGLIGKWAGSGEQVFLDYQGNILPW